MACGLVLFAAFSTVAADDAKRGRLPDGTAFRTDAAGSQLVDYVAELEMTVEELLRRVHSLEDELEEKKEGVTVSAPLVERNIGETAPPQVPSRVTDVELMRCRASLSSCAVNLEAVKQQTMELMNSAAKSAERPVAQPVVADLRPQVEQLQTILAERENALRAKEIELTAERQRVEATERQFREIKAAAPVEKHQLAAAIIPIAIPAAAAPEVVPARAPLVVEVPAEPIEEIVVPKPSEMRASVDFSRIQALQATKGKLHTEYNRLQSSLRGRDALYERFKSSSSPVRIQPLKIGQNELATLSANIDQSTDSSELSMTAARIAELRSKVESDVGLMQRVLRSR